MRIGIIADVHEDVEHLREALRSLGRARADRIVCLGDVCEDGMRIEETCRLLEEAGASGLWGNHDYGLCTSPIENLLELFPERVIRYAHTFTASLVLEDCYFSHIEPGLDPNVLADLWNPLGPPREPERLRRIWNAVPQRRMFMGHVHCPYSVTPAGSDDWDGERLLRMPRRDQRLVVVGAVCMRSWALLDTDRDELVPKA